MTDQNELIGSERRGIAVAKYAFGALVVFICCLVWFYVSWTSANRTHDWTPTPARIVGHEQAGSVVRTRQMRLLTNIHYTFDDVDYEKSLPEYLLGRDITVYVDPNNPRAVVSSPGVEFRDIARPLIGMIVSAAFALVLVLIAFSPKED